MAKKSSKPVESDKVAFQVRFDRDLHEQLTKVAEKSDISLNQLVQGICRGVVADVQFGRPVEHVAVEHERREEREVVVLNETAKGCVWFGEKGVADNERCEVVSRGVVWFRIDTTERGQVRRG